MQSCPLHRDVVLELTQEGVRCFLCRELVEPVEVDEPATKILEFRRPDSLRRAEVPGRQEPDHPPIDDEDERRIKFLSDALQREPTDGQLVHRLAHALEQAGRDAEAADVYFRRAHACMENGLAILAAPLLRQAVRLAPGHHEARRLLIEACYDLELRDELVLELEALWVEYRREGLRAKSYEALDALQRLAPNFTTAVPAMRMERRRCEWVMALASDLVRRHDVTRLDVILRDIEFVLPRMTIDAEVLEAWIACRLYGDDRRAVIDQLDRLRSGAPEAVPLMLLLARLLEGTARQVEVAALYKRVLPYVDDEELRVELRAQIERLRSAS